jgi:cytochrome c peroxidase
MRGALGRTALLALVTLSTAGADVLAPPDPLPARLLSGPLVVQQKPTPALLGALLFRSPELLGEEARALGVSCQTCHPNGGRHATLSLSTASPAPGLVDLTSGRFGAPDDGVANAVVIPTLRELRARGRFLTSGARADLEQTVLAHVVDDLAGAPPTRDDLVALVRFLELLAPRENPFVDERGRLTERASPAARKGEAVFTRGHKGLSGQSCASCHVPAGAFTDGRTWPMRPGAMPHVRTPSLKDVGERGPFFVDGRAATLLDVVVDYDTRFALKLSSADKDALAAYLAAVGGSVVVDERSVESALVEQTHFLRLLDGDDVSSRDCQLALARIDEALSLRAPPPRIAFKIDGARARIAQLAKGCGSAGEKSTLRGDLTRLGDDVTRLAGEWQDLLTPPAPDDR